MKTQKQMLADVQAVAVRANATVTVRKNSYGEYDVRVRLDGKPFANSFGSTFADGIDTAQAIIGQIVQEQEKQERLAEKRYQHDLEVAIEQAGTILALVGCRIEVDPFGLVTMYSPKTGSHSLNMVSGVRPVSDLIAHVCGFAEQQTHVKAKPVETKPVDPAGHNLIGHTVTHSHPRWSGETGVVLGPTPDGRVRVQWRNQDGSVESESNVPRYLTVVS